MKILQVVGYKNSGKTATIRMFIEYVKTHGKSVAVIKHHHLDKAVIRESVDTGKFVASGAEFSILNTPSYSELTQLHDNDVVVQLNNQLEFLEKSGIDFVFIEGYKDQSYPKISLNYSFGQERETDINDIGLEAVLETFDLRYDKEKMLSWFKGWSDLS